MSVQRVRACRRCDWKSSDDEGGLDGWELAILHAGDAGHPLCSVCHQSLRGDETGTCVRCLGRARASLAYVSRAWADVEAVAPSPVGQRLGTSGKSAGTTVPGGLAAVLRGNGSSGVAGMLAGDDYLEQPDDPPSVLWTLRGHVHDWWSSRDWPAKLPALDVPAMCEWLEARLSWAAAEHPEFAEFAADMASLEAWIRRATGQIEAPLKSPVTCLEDHGRPVRLEKPLTAAGFGDSWECPFCGREYDPGSYALAVGEHLRRAAEVRSISGTNTANPVDTGGVGG